MRRRDIRHLGLEDREYGLAVPGLPTGGCSIGVVGIPVFDNLFDNRPNPDVEGFVAVVGGSFSSVFLNIGKRLAEGRMPLCTPSGFSMSFSETLSRFSGPGGKTNGGGRWCTSFRNSEFAGFGSEGNLNGSRALIFFF